MQIGMANKQTFILHTFGSQFSIETKAEFYELKFLHVFVLLIGSIYCYILKKVSNATKHFIGFSNFPKESHYTLNFLALFQFPPFQNTEFYVCFTCYYG